MDIKVGIVEIIQKKSLVSYFGHVERISEERYPNMLLYGKIEGARPRGRPKTKWIDNIQENVQMGHTVSEANRLARDGCRWRIAIHINLGCQRASI